MSSSYSKFFKSSAKGKSNFYKRACHPNGNNLIGKIGEGGLYVGGWTREAKPIRGGYTIDLAGWYEVPGSTTRAFSRTVQVASKTGVAMLSLHIPDMGIPEYPATMWEVLAQEIRVILSKGHHVLIACLGGHGRTGMVASIVAHILGMIPEGESPVKWIRRVYCDECVETPEQEKYVHAMLGLAWNDLPEIKDNECLACGVGPLQTSYGDDLELQICADCIRLYSIGGKPKKQTPSKDKKHLYGMEYWYTDVELPEDDDIPPYRAPKLHWGY